MKIPVGNFGYQVAQPGPRPRLAAGEFDSGAAGLDQVGRSLMQAGLNGLDAINRQAEEDKRQAQALAKAKAANAILDHETEVSAVTEDIKQQLSDGRLKHTDAAKEYQTRVGQIKTSQIDGIDPVTAENYSKGLKRAEFSGEKTLYSAVATARTADFRTQADGLLDKIGKKASLPGSSVEQLNAYIDTPDADAMGRQAYGANWEKKKQDWKDSNWNSSISQQAMSARNDLKSIDTLMQRITSGDLSDKLDSDKRNMQVAKLDGYKTSLIQRQEAAAQRAERQAERYLKQAEAEFNTFQALSDKGAMVNPDYIDQVMAKTAGTPYQRGISALVKQAQENGGIASQPIVRQQATLDQLDAQIAKVGRTPELDKRREQVSKVLQQSQRDLKENGLRAGLERGVIENMAPIDISTPEAFASSISKRLEQAQTVGMWSGTAVSPLDAREAESMRTMLEALPAKQRSQAIATVSASVGPKAATAIAMQLDKQSKPLALAFATATQQTTQGRYTSELILRGDQAIRDGAVMKDDKKVTGWKASIAQEIDGAFGNENTAQAVKDAAYYITAGIAAENGGNAGGSDIKRAVRLAVGGDIIERNGKKLPIPAGMDASDFEARLKTSAGAVAKQGSVRVAGVEMSGEEFAASLPGQELMPVGSGRYAVIVKGRPVTSNGKPVIVEVK